MTRGESCEICDCRTKLETSALRLALLRDGAGLAAWLDAAVDRMAAARDQGRVRDYLRLDRDFHQALFDACGNRYLAAVHGLIAGQMAALRSRLGTDATQIEKFFREHAQIARKEGAYRALQGGLGPR